MNSAVHTLRLILGDQLNPDHSWFDCRDDGVVYVLMEVRQETDYALHHAQKILAIFAAMRDFSSYLRSAGHRVRYIQLDDPSNRQSLTANLSALIHHYRALRIQWQEPDEWRLQQQLQEWSATLTIPAGQVGSEHFLATPDEMRALFANQKQWLMERFYRYMRVRHQVLLTPDRKPVGGQWNFDSENRKPWRGTPTVPLDWRPVHDHRLIWDMLERSGVASFGLPQAEQCRWPLNRAEALNCVDYFIENVLVHFGEFEDAMSSQSPRLFHSLLSFALNVKMLKPIELVRRAEAAYSDGKVSLAAAEGFIRQILGWREYVRGIYWLHMPGYEQKNVLNHQRLLPAWFWSGETKMRCLSLAIRQSLQTAHAHHIQRLMVIGNFGLLAGIHPYALHLWYLGVYADAFEWVELPNTLGMSQFADGGLIATKPYVSSGAYINRMSDYCVDCHYKVKDKTGEQACPYNALYWDFFIRHEPAFGKNPRLGMVYQQIRRFDKAQLTAIQTKAADIREQLESL